MPYLIDGHNLIPEIPGLNLSMVDDEMQLIKQLQSFCQESGKKVEVFFDKAPAGGAGKRNFGRVTARFVRAGKSADAAIQDRLAQLGREAANWTVVSSDHQVQQSARYAHAQAMPSAEFARLMSAAPHSGEEGEDLDPLPSNDEIDAWLRLFEGDK
jgi:predicted RNA-binding protein with PIN domain